MRLPGKGHRLLPGELGLQWAAATPPREAGPCLKPNTFDPGLLKEQRALMSRTYDAIRTPRLILENRPHVALADIRMSRELREGKIWPF